MRPQCVDPVCTVPIEPGWEFCPACGTDNRPPRDRTPVRDHRHECLGRQGRCVRCGEPADEPYAFNRKWRVRIAGTLLVLGGACLLAIAFIQLGLALPATNLGAWVTGWYARDAFYHARYGGYVAQGLYGDRVVVLLVAAGVFLTATGAWMALKLPAPEGDVEPDGWD